MVVSSEQRSPAPTIIVRGGLMHSEVHGALAAHFPAARIVSGHQDLPADVILPGGVGVLIAESADGLPDARGVEVLCRTFKRPVIFCTFEALDRIALHLDTCQRDKCAVLPCASASDLARDLAQLTNLQGVELGINWEAHAASVEDELLQRLSAGSGVPPIEVRALLHALPLVDILSASHADLVDASPLLPASTSKLYHWMNSGRSRGATAAV